MTVSTREYPQIAVARGTPGARASGSLGAPQPATGWAEEGSSVEPSTPHRAKGRRFRYVGHERLPGAKVPVTDPRSSSLGAAVSVEPGRTWRPSRIGDEERHKCADLLTDHHAHGRLSQEEFEERLAVALTAQTPGELGRVLADLPLPTRSQPAPRPSRARSATTSIVGTIRQFGLAVAVPLIVALVLIWPMGIANYQAAQTFFVALVSSIIGVIAGVRATSRRRGRDR